MLEQQKLMCSIWVKGYIDMWIDLYNEIIDILETLIKLILTFFTIILSPITLIVLLPFAKPYYRMIDRKNKEWRENIYKQLENRQ